MSDDDTIPLGSVGTNVGYLPASINRFNGRRKSHNRVIYEDDAGTRITVRHHKSGQHGRRRKYQLTLYGPDGERIQSRTIKHGSYQDRYLSEAAEAVEAQIWEWGRHAPEERRPVNVKIESRGEPKRHPPGESPVRSNAWYYSFTLDRTSVSDPEKTFDYGEIVPQSRYEFTASNDDAEWYCGRVVVTFAHSAPESVQERHTSDEECVWGTYIYTSRNRLKPVSERESPRDKREIIRNCVRNDDDHEPLSHEALLDEIDTARETLVDAAEALGDDHRQQIRQEAQRRLNEETGEYETQMRLSGF